MQCVEVAFVADQDVFLPRSKSQIPSIVPFFHF